jgi:hypothetical protein
MCEIPARFPEMLCIQRSCSSILMNFTVRFPRRVIVRSHSPCRVVAWAYSSGSVNVRTELEGITISTLVVSTHSASTILLPSISLWLRRR